LHKNYAKLGRFVERALLDHSVGDGLVYAKKKREPFGSAQGKEAPALKTYVYPT